MSLAVELMYFEKHRVSWCQSHLGKYVIVRGEELGGFYSDFTPAFRAGIKKWPDAESFLVKRVLPVDEVFAVFTAGRKA